MNKKSGITDSTIPLTSAEIATIRNKDWGYMYRDADGSVYRALCVRLHTENGRIWLDDDGFARRIPFPEKPVLIAGKRRPCKGCGETHPSRFTTIVGGDYCDDCL